MIRHPVARTHSHWHNLMLAHTEGMSKNHKEGWMGTINNQKHWLYDFLKDYPVSLDNTKEVSFIVACLNLFACSQDAGYQKYQHLKIESLNTAALATFIDELSNGKIKLDGQEIEKIKTVRNSHLATFHQKSSDKKDYNDSLTTQEKYLSWLPWQQQLYQICVKKSKLDERYKEYQYDLS